MTDGYLITAQLGAGDMGTVFLAQHRNSGQLCALKRAAPHAAGADALALGLHHPNIIALHDAGQAGVAMEYVDGPNLRTVLDAGLPSPAQALRWTAQLLAALDCLHAHGLVHRDVKPANLLLAPDGSVKLADFGIARRAGEGPVHDNDHSGTPNYMAPEQLRGAPADPRSDVYAAGVVLYEMLAGGRPYRGSAFEVMQQALRGELVPPSARRAALGPRYDALLARALAADPARRFADARQFHTDLQAASSAQL